MSDKIFYIRMNEEDCNKLLDEFKTSDLTTAIKKMADKYYFFKEMYLMNLKHALKFNEAH